jgi:hypothetical protein
MRDMVLDGSRHTQVAVQRRLIHAGQDGDADKERRILDAIRRLPRRPEHCAPAARMDIDHPDAPTRRRPHRARDRIGNVVELGIVEKAVRARFGQTVEDLGPGGIDQFQADFKAADMTAQRADERQSGIGVVYIEGDKDSFGTHLVKMTVVGLV